MPKNPFQKAGNEGSCMHFSYPDLQKPQQLPKIIFPSLFLLYRYIYRKFLQLQGDFLISKLSVAESLLER